MQVSSVPSVDYRQHQRHQADGRLAALALRALGICEIRGFARPVGWSPRGRLPLVGRADPEAPIRRSVATINSASVVNPRQWRAEYTIYGVIPGSQDDAGNWPLSRTLRQQVSYGMADRADGADSRVSYWAKTLGIPSSGRWGRFAPVRRL
jgi:hypothetical protein